MFPLILGVTLLFCLSLVARLFTFVVDPLFYNEMLISKRRYKVIPRYFMTGYFAFFISKAFTSPMTIENVDSVRYALSALIQSEATLMAVCISIGIILPQVFANTSKIKDFNLDYRDYDLMIVASFFGVSIAVTALLLFSLDSTTEQRYLKEAAGWSFTLFVISLSSLFPFIQSEIGKATVTGQFSILLGRIENRVFLESTEEGFLARSEIIYVIRFLETIMESQDMTALRRTCYLFLRKCRLSLIRGRKKNHEVRISEQLLSEMRKLERQSRKSDVVVQTELLAVTNSLIDVISFGELNKDKIIRAFTAHNMQYGSNIVRISLELAKHAKIDRTNLSISLLECLALVLYDKQLASLFDNSDIDEALALSKQLLAVGNREYVFRMFVSSQKLDRHEMKKAREAINATFFGVLFAAYDLYADRRLTDFTFFNNVLLSAFSGSFLWETDVVKVCFLSKFIEYFNKNTQNDRAQSFYDNLLSLSKDQTLGGAVVKIILNEIDRFLEFVQDLSTRNPNQ